MTRPLRGSDVVVLGAGVAGLAVAAALAGQGARVTVHERAAAANEIGAGVQISPNGMAVLRALGVVPQIEAASMRAEAVQLLDGISGRGVLRLDLTRSAIDRPYRFLHRANLVGILAEAAVAAGATLAYGQAARDVTLDSPRPVVRTDGGDTLVPDLLVGADGLRSITHRSLNGVTAPFFTRQAAWRMLIPCEPGAAPVAEVHLGPGRHVVSYPLRDGTLRNVVAVEERAEWLAEGWALHGDSDILRATFADFAPRVRGWLAAVDQVGLWGLYRHPVARRWHAALGDGAAVILGDAAHPMLPFLAQGANMALEDAWVLVQSLDRHGIGETGLAEYHRLRHARVQRVVDRSTGNARAFHLRTPFRQVAHAGLRLGGWLTPVRMMRRQDWIWRHDVTAPDD